MEEGAVRGVHAACGDQGAAAAGLQAGLVSNRTRYLGSSCPEDLSSKRGLSWQPLPLAQRPPACLRQLLMMLRGAFLCPSQHKQGPSLSTPCPPLAIIFSSSWGQPAPSWVLVFWKKINVPSFLSSFLSFEKECHGSLADTPVRFPPCTAPAGLACLLQRHILAWAPKPGRADLLPASLAKGLLHRGQCRSP